MSSFCVILFIFPSFFSFTPLQGAAISPIITLLWKNRFPSVNMRCIAYSPPHLFNYELAESDWMKEHVTTIVYSNDLVPRLSLSALWRLKNQMMYAFQLCNHSKFTVMHAAINRDLDKVFIRPFNQQDYDTLVNKPLDPDLLCRMVEEERRRQHEEDEKEKQKHHTPRNKTSASSGSGSKEESHDELASEKAEHGDASG